MKGLNTLEPKRLSSFTKQEVLCVSYSHQIKLEDFRKLIMICQITVVDILGICIFFKFSNQLLSWLAGWLIKLV